MMEEVTIVYPHQLFTDSPAVSSGRMVYLVEESLLLTRNPIHRQRLMLHKLSMDAYEKELQKKGCVVVRISITECGDTAAVWDRLRHDGVVKIHVADTTDFLLEKAIAASGFERVWYESPMFVLEKDDAVRRYVKSKRHMAAFYKQLRTDANILMTEDGKPLGGQWSFDAENRKKLPKDVVVPKDIALQDSSEIAAASVWADTVSAEQYGAAGCWLPYTAPGAEKFLQEFLRTRFAHFGTYEDALSTRGVRLFHATLSPLMNIGLLTPKQVLDTAVQYAAKNEVPINALEGFVRQVVGWREFIRAAYECDGVTMRTGNFWQHTKKIPDAWWNGSVGLPPVDIAIERALQFGYTHHIERLMVLGNSMLLSSFHPDEVYRWFMGMYIDAYDWVMVPNVYGMSQFADGGIFATKPYISGSNYIKKMSDYQKGDWEDIWTALYWHFIDTHKDFFTTNHRLSMMPRLLEKMDGTKREEYAKLAKVYFDSL